MVKRLLVVIILVSAAWTAGCQPDESAAPGAPSAVTEVLEKTEAPQEAPAQTEPSTLSPAIVAPSETADAEPKETSESTTGPGQNARIEIQPATESKEPPAARAQEEPTSETTVDSDKESPKETGTGDPAELETDEEPPAAKNQDPPKTEDAAGSEKESAKEADSDDPGKSGSGREPDFKVGAPDLYEKCKYVLATFVDKHGKVDYYNLRRKRSKLIAATRAFSEIDPVEYFQWSDNEKIAFWINAYNILTLSLVVENYPIKPLWWRITYPPNSIIHIPGAWTKKYFDVMGIEYTLREIEREILMARFKDPRICFTFSYATLGGALLRNEPYYPNKLDEQLDDQVKKFLATPQGLTIDHQEEIVRLGDIFNWYKGDFIEEYGDIKRFRDRPAHIQAYLNCIVKYISSDNLKYIESKDYDVKFIKYDWRLNEQPNK